MYSICSDLSILLLGTSSFHKHISFSYDIVLLKDCMNSFLFFLSTQDKAGSHKNIYPYIVQEIRPTLDELGLSTPEELGLDRADV